MKLSALERRVYKDTSPGNVLLAIYFGTDEAEIRKHLAEFGVEHNLGGLYQPGGSSSRVAMWLKEDEHDGLLPKSIRAFRVLPQRWLVINFDPKTRTFASISVLQDDKHYLEDL